MSDTTQLTELRPGRQVYLQIHPGGAHPDTAIFLAHGGGGNLAQWRNQWQWLKDSTEHRLIAWDFPGHGRSPVIAQQQAYTAEQQLQDYAQLLQTHGARRNILIGHSYGALLTLALLQQLHGRQQLGTVDRVALLGIPAINQPVPPLLHAPVWLLRLLRPLLEKGFNERAWHADTDAKLIEQEKQQARNNSLYVFKALIRQFPRIDEAGLKHLNLPVLLLAGETDGLAPAAAARQLASLLPQARLEVIAQSAHQLMLEQPERTNAALQRFLNEERTPL